MSSQNPYDPSNATPPTQYAQASEYVPASPYEQQQQGYPPVNPYGQQPQPGYAPANPYGQQPMAYPPQFVPVLVKEPGRGQAMAGMILGIVGMILWLLPFLGLPIGIVGLIMSILGRRSVSRKGMALAGLILSIITLVLALSNCALGAYLATRRY